MSIPSVETATVRLSFRPERIFISVDTSTGRSTVSFSPAGAGSPIVHEGDATGELALRTANSVVETYRTATIHGPHFHDARPQGRKRMTRRPSNQGSGNG